MKDENYYVSLPAKEHIQTSSLASGCRSTLRALRKWDANCYCLTGIKNENTEIGSAPSSKRTLQRLELRKPSLGFLLG